MLLNAVPIPVGREYTVTCEVTVPKTARCERCHREYHYLMRRQASGSASSPLFLDNRGASERARERAEDALHLIMRADCDPVPCPDCGWYQAAMVARIRRSYRRWMVWVGAVLLVVAAPTFATSLARAALAEPAGDSSVRTLQIVAASLAVAGLGMMIGRKVMAMRYDPNQTDPEERRRIAESRVIRKEERDERLRLLEGGPEA